MALHKRIGFLPAPGDHGFVDEFKPVTGVLVIHVR